MAAPAPSAAARSPQHGAVLAWLDSSRPSVREGLISTEKTQTAPRGSNAACPKPLALPSPPAAMQAVVMAPNQPPSARAKTLWRRWKSAMRLGAPLDSPRRLTAGVLRAAASRPNPGHSNDLQPLVAQFWTPPSVPVAAEASAVNLPGRVVDAYASTLYASEPSTPRGSSAAAPISQQQQWPSERGQGMTRHPIRDAAAASAPPPMTASARLRGASAPGGSEATLAPRTPSDEAAQPPTRRQQQQQQNASGTTTHCEMLVATRRQAANTALMAYPAVTRALPLPGQHQQLKQQQQQQPKQQPSFCGNQCDADDDAQLPSWLLRAALLEDELQGRALEVRDQLAAAAEARAGIDGALLSLRGCRGGGPVAAARQQLATEAAAIDARVTTLTQRATELGSGIAALQGAQAVMAGPRAGALGGSRSLAVLQLVLADVTARLPGENLRELDVLRGLPELDAAGDHVCGGSDGAAAAGGGGAVAAPGHAHGSNQQQQLGATADSGACNSGGDGGGDGDCSDSGDGGGGEDADDSGMVAALSSALQASHYTPRRSLAYEARHGTAGSSSAGAAGAAGNNTTAAAEYMAWRRPPWVEEDEDLARDSSGAVACITAVAGVAVDASTAAKPPSGLRAPHVVAVPPTATTTPPGVPSPVCVGGRGNDSVRSSGDLTCVTALSGEVEVGTALGVVDGECVGSVSTAPKAGLAAGHTRAPPSAAAGAIAAPPAALLSLPPPNDLGSCAVQQLLPPGAPGLEQMTVGELLRTLTAAVLRQSGTDA